MSTKQTEALKMALAALEVATTPLATDRQEVLRARAAIREALEQPAQQEPWPKEPFGHIAGGVQPAQQQEAHKQQEIEELTTQRDKLADILTRTANALKGQPAELSAHSWHDLPEVAQQLKAAQQQEPVAHMNRNGVVRAIPYPWGDKEVLTPLYPHPPASKPLTDEELSHIYEEYHDCYGQPINGNENGWAYERAIIQAAHGIK